jgi:membrane protease YdiL (CAAX protease family)
MLKKQFPILAILLVAYALIVMVSYLFFYDQMTQGAPVPATTAALPSWMGLAVAGVVFVVYGLLGLAGYWFARKLDLSGIFRETGNWRSWFWMPLAFGLVLGIFLAIVDQMVAASGLGPHFPHPTFPFSILASLSAGIGEEIIFRGFVFGLWAFLLNLVLKRWNNTKVALWIANIIAALAFGASHFPAAMLLFGVTTPAAIPPFVIGEIFLLNGVIGIAAGERYMKDGLIAAVGVHFWADVVWHVIWPFIFV